MEILPDWNVPKEQKLNWLVNYETVENQQFLKAVSDCGDVGELRLRLGVTLKGTGEVIGWCCTGMKDELPAPNREIVFAISNEHSKKGYTTQAVQGLIAYLFNNTDTSELNAVALTRNTPSNRVIQKCGFKCLNSIEIDGSMYNHYKLYKRDWMERHDH